MAPGGMPKGSSNWRCTFQIGRQSIVVHYSQGPALKKEPTAEDVMGCVALDARGLGDNVMPFEEWADEYGYDPDSRKAEHIYRLCLKQREELLFLLGYEAFFRLMTSTELD